MISSALAGGIIGTLAMATIIKAASELGVTRMDLALLLGTTVTENRRKARAVGYFLYFVIGAGFAVAYGELFAIIGRSSKPSIRTPLSSFIVKLAGPTIRSCPRPRSRRSNSSREGGKMKIATDSGSFCFTWAAPCTSISSTRSSPFLRDSSSHFFGVP